MALMCKRKKSFHLSIRIFKSFKNRITDHEVNKRRNQPRSFIIEKQGLMPVEILQVSELEIILKILSPLKSLTIFNTNNRSKNTILQANQLTLKSCLEL